MKRVLVTGAFGFLGSHLAEALLDRGDDVILVDNFQNNVIAKDFFSKYKNLNVLTIPCSDFTSDKKIDEIYHCASVVGPAGVLPFAGRIGPLMVNDGKHMMELAATHKARLLFVSTSEIYGRDGFFSEDVPKIVPIITSARLEYAIGKLLCEIMLINRQRSHGDIQFNIVRPFNIAGPRQSPKGGFVLPRFLLQALHNEPLTVFGSGNQIRCFTHVLDIVSGIFAIMNSDRVNEVFNVGNPANLTTIHDLANLVKQITGTPAAIQKVDPKQIYGSLYEEAFDKIPDSTKLTTAVKWQPTRSLRIVVEDTLTFYRDHPELTQQPLAAAR
ncbi:MAG: NAD-dependent epimerase/dehydratase family protein [Elusimicrobiota bacterium]|jgi:nucleoside-diphosphate-sugar epimerase